MTSTTQELTSMLNDMAENFMGFSRTSENTMHRDLYLARAELARQAASRLSELEAEVGTLREIMGRINNFALIYFSREPSPPAVFGSLMKALQDARAALDKGEPKP